MHFYKFLKIFLLNLIILSSIPDHILNFIKITNNLLLLFRFICHICSRSVISLYGWHSIYNSWLIIFISLVEITLIIFWRILLFNWDGSVSWFFAASLSTFSDWVLDIFHAVRKRLVWGWGFSSESLFKFWLFPCLHHQWIIKHY